MKEDRPGQRHSLSPALPHTLPRRLDLDAALQRRLKVAAAIKGISMRAYCQSAIEKALEQDERQGPGRVSRESVDRMDAIRMQVWQGRSFSDDSTEVIREMREERSAVR